MRECGLLPQESEAEMPEPYRLWRACQRHDTLWWSGGISNQPYIMMLEFQACEYARAIFDEQVKNYQDILNANTNRAGQAKSAG